MIEAVRLCYSKVCMVSTVIFVSLTRVGTSLICIVLILCLGLFLLEDMF